jgi:hypothetical protein
LRKELNIPIARKSNVSLTIANGKTIASLGIAEIMVEINKDLGIDLEVEVIDLNSRDLILGTDLLKYGIIDMREELLTIELDREEYEIPIDFKGRKDNKENKSENKSNTEFNENSSDSSENKYKENSKEELFSFVEETQINNKENDKTKKRSWLKEERDVKDARY